jgi:hypothetical protein
VNSEVYPEFLPKGTRIDRPSGESIVLRNYAELLIEASCELVLARGDKDLEVKEVEVILNKKTCENLRRYFFIPSHNRLGLRLINIYEDEPSLQPILLEPKRTIQFKREIYLDCSDDFKKEYEKMENGSRPEPIQSLLDELENKYKICWTRYDGKRVCWKFPDKWYRNLGKKLWG